jgi:hypothetical protein
MQAENHSGAGLLDSSLVARGNFGSPKICFIFSFGGRQNFGKGTDKQQRKQIWTPLPW